MLASLRYLNDTHLIKHIIPLSPNALKPIPAPVTANRNSGEKIDFLVKGSVYHCGLGWVRGINLVFGCNAPHVSHNGGRLGQVDLLVRLAVIVVTWALIDLKEGHLCQLVSQLGRC